MSQSETNPIKAFLAKLVPIMPVLVISLKVFIEANTILKMFYNIESSIESVIMLFYIIYANFGINWSKSSILPVLVLSLKVFTEATTNILD
jgi:hypothetical protein